MTYDLPAGAVQLPLLLLLRGLLQRHVQQVTHHLLLLHLRVGQQALADRVLLDLHLLPLRHPLPVQLLDRLVGVRSDGFHEILELLLNVVDLSRGWGHG